MLQILDIAAARSRIEQLQRGEILAVIGFARESIAEVLREDLEMKQGAFFLHTGCR